MVSVIGFTAWTATLAKRSTAAPAALAQIRFISQPGAEAEGGGAAALLGNDVEFETVPVQLSAADGSADTAQNVSDVQTHQIQPISPPTVAANLIADRTLRWFNGRPIRPIRTMTMTVTGYSPDARSCGDSADGITATLHSVTTNAHKLVAADPKLLPYGSLVSVPGYDLGRVVPVLDCGAMIKGRRLDLLYPTHEQALNWGNRPIRVTVWGYADGKPTDNPRKLR